MLRNQEVCNFLTNSLNNAIDNQDIKFTIYSENGKCVNDNTIKGVLRVVKNEHLPIPDVKNTNYNAIVEFLTPANCSNKYLEKVESVINAFRNNWNGKQYTFNNGKGTITFSSALTDYFKTEYGVGNTVPLRMVLSIIYTEEMVSSGQKHWFLDDMEIPYLKEEILLEKNGITKVISGNNYQKTFLTSQTKLYRFVVPFDLGNDFCKVIQQDILDNSANKEYTLKYYDGVTYTENEPYERKVSLVRTNDEGSERPNLSIFNLTFSDVYVKKNIVYEMGLIDNPFDGQSEDTMYFDSLDQQHTWFDNKVANGCDYVEIPIPNLDSIDITNQIYEFDEEKYNVFDVTKKNYAVIRVTQHKDKPNEKKYYFFYQVTNPQIGAENQVSFDLSLDSVQTYYFLNEIKLEGTFIQKTLLNRWRQVDSTTIEFNGKADSKLFEREEIKNVAKRLVFREKLKYYCDKNKSSKYTPLEEKPSYLYANGEYASYFYLKDGEYKSTYEMTQQEYDETDTFYTNKERTMIENINEIVECWCYIYLDDVSYNVLNNSGQSAQVTLQNAYNQIVGGFELPTAILCFPITRQITSTWTTDLRLRINPEDLLEDLYINIKGFEGLKSLNEDLMSNKLKGIKLSVKPPIDFNSSEFYNVNYDGFSFGYDTIKDNVYVLANLRLGVIRTQQDAGLFYVLNDYSSSTKMSIDQPITELKFSKNNVITNKNKKFNPKLNGMDYKTLVLTIAGSSFEMPIDKMNVENPVFEYFEALIPETTKGMLRFYKGEDENIEQGINNAVFNEYYRNSFNGFTYSNDFTIAFAKEVYAEYIANNKNAYLSFQAQQDYNRNMNEVAQIQNVANTARAVGSALGETNALGMASPNVVKAGVEAAAGAVNMITTQMSYQHGQALRQTQFDLSIDNMKNAPNTLSNINGSAILTKMITSFGIYLELHEGLDHELEIANDIMNRDGYTYNQFDDVKKYDKIRKFYNYIKANIGTITGIPISNQARLNLRQRFANGIRFWNMNENNEFVVDYSKENYEKWIETNATSFEDWVENQ